MVTTKINALFENLGLYPRVFDKLIYCPEAANLFYSLVFFYLALAHVHFGLSGTSQIGSPAISYQTPCYIYPPKWIPYPLGEKSIANTFFKWPCNAIKHLPDLRSHILAQESMPQVPTSDPSGWNCTLYTGREWPS